MMKIENSEVRPNEDGTMEYQCTITFPIRADEMLVVQESFSDEGGYISKFAAEVEGK